MKNNYRAEGIFPEKVCQNSTENELDKNIWIPFQKIPNVSKFRVELSG
jgi:hypothetical protein